MFGILTYISTQAQWTFNTSLLNKWEFKITKAYSQLDYDNLLDIPDVDVCIFSLLNISWKHATKWWLLSQSLEMPVCSVTNINYLVFTILINFPDCSFLLRMVICLLFVSLISIGLFTCTSVHHLDHLKTR